jgi:hypothetical protein
MIEHRFICKCDECGKEKVVSAQEDLPAFHGLHQLQTWVPESWSYVRGRLICDEHQVIVKPEENS